MVFGSVFTMNYDTINLAIDLEFSEGIYQILRYSDLIISTRKN